MVLVPVFGLLAAASWSVSLSTGTSSTTCAANNVLADTLRQAPTARTRWVDSGETASARRDHGRWTVDLAGKVASGPTLIGALESAWPDDGPPPARLKPPPYEVLLLACAGEVARAYEVAGAAVPIGLARFDAPATPGRSAPLLRRLAYGLHRGRAGRAKAALPHLRAVVARFDEGEAGPVWRQAASFEEPPVVTVLGERVAAFEDGAFEVRSLATGDLLWRRHVGTAEPGPVPLGDDAFVIVLVDGVEALDAASGEPKWRVDLEDPRAEVAVDADHAYVSDREAVTAVDRHSGAVVWRYDGLSAPVAGPVRVRDSLAVPLETKVVILDPTDGREESVVELDDELSAPLVPTASGNLWALVGSDEVVHITGRPWALKHRSPGLSGVDWPPALLGDALLVAAGTHPRGADLLYVDPTEGRPARRGRRIAPPLVAGANAALVVHGADRGRVLAGRAANGRRIWATKVGGPGAPVSAWGVAGPHVAVASGRTVKVIGRDTGEVAVAVGFEERVVAFAYGEAGGAAVLADGAWYGVPPPTDPRIAVWRQDAGIALARAALQTGRLGLARKAAASARGGARDFEALGLLAEIETKLERPSAVAAWLSVIDAAPPGDPRAEQGRRAVARQAGVLALVTTATAHQVHGAGSWVVVETDDAVEGRRTSALADVAWTRPKAAAGAVLDGLVEVGQRWLRLDDGQPTLGDGVRPLGEGLLWVETADGATIRTTGESGESGRDGRDRGWSRAVPDGLSSAVVRDGLLVLWGEHSVAVWSAQTGRPVWRRGRRAPTLDAWRVGKRVLLRTRGGVHVVLANNGIQKYRIAVSPEAPFVVGRRQAIYAEGQSIKFLAVERGRLSGKVDTGASVRGLWLAGDRLFAALGDGSLVAVDPRRRRQLGRAPIDARSAAVVAGGLVVADTRGRLMFIDGKRALRPE